MKLNFKQTQICDDLVRQGFAVLDNFFEPDLIGQLQAECQNQYQLGLLHAAGIGRSTELQVEQSIRGDQIRWLEPGMSEAVDRYLDYTEQLRNYFNKQLFLGLQESENHFACYPQGAFYQKHIDRFRQDDSRVISTVLYLNSGWQSGNGGELRLHLENLIEDIKPVANRLVMFISAKIMHEVLVTNVERMSLTGWFRRAN